MILGSADLSVDKINSSTTITHLHESVVYNYKIEAERLIIPKCIITIRDGCSYRSAFFSEDNKSYCILCSTLKEMEKCIGFNVIIKPAHLYPYYYWKIIRQGQLF